MDSHDPDAPLPVNLSPLNTSIFSWIDESGSIHMAFFDGETFDEATKDPNFDFLDYMGRAKFIYSMNGINAYMMAEALLHHGGRVLREGKPMDRPPLAPLPFPTDARQRIYEQLRGATQGELPDVASVMAGVDDILGVGRWTTTPEAEKALNDLDATDDPDWSSQA
jgi:hypothetical protein